MEGDVHYIYVNPPFYSEKDAELGKVVKKRKVNPIGENVFLRPDGSIEREEDKIIAAQRIFKHEYYRPGGPGFLKGLKSFDDHIRTF
jgi:hypothetical protein